jgi:hypothetical protein
MPALASEEFRQDLGLNRCSRPLDESQGKYDDRDLSHRLESSVLKDRIVNPAASVATLLRESENSPPGCREHKPSTSKTDRGITPASHQHNASWQTHFVP